MKLPKKVDYLIVGAGVVGLSILKKLLAENKNVLLIEKSGDSTGSLLSDSLELNSLVWTQEQHTDLFTYPDKTKETFTIGKKGLIPFMGFGNEKVLYPEIVDSFTSQNSHIATGLKEDAFTNLESSIINYTQITAMDKHDNNDHYTVFEINGKTHIEAKNVIWTAPIQELDFTLPKEGFQDFRQKIKKALYLDGLTVIFKVNKENLSESAHQKFIFLGEDNTPWFGSIIGDDSFIFTSFFSHLLSGDHSFLQKNLKNLKRKLQKHFPEIFNEDIQQDFSNEKICTHRSVLSKINLNLKKGKLKELQNFTFLGSHKDFWPQTLDQKLTAYILSEKDSALPKAPPAL